MSSDLTLTSLSKIKKYKLKFPFLVTNMKKLGKDQYVSTDGITFGGVNWEALYVISYDGVVSTVKFASKITPQNKSIMNGVAKDLFGMLT